MKILDRHEYCLSCEHILDEQGYKFNNLSEQGRPYASGQVCKRCGGLLEPLLEQTANDKNLFATALNNPKVKVVAFVAPSVRAGIGQCFNLCGDQQFRLVAALKALGCYNVFSMNFGADLTITEESHELAERINKNGKLPMLSSCCPAWVNYIYKLKPELLSHLSTCKSPQQMMGAVLNTYYLQTSSLNFGDVFVASIVPCLAKKVERVRPGINAGQGHDVDACITTVELAELIKERGLDFASLPEQKFDDLLGQYSGGAANFGAAGGVSESVVCNMLQKDVKFTFNTRGNVIEKSFNYHNKTYTLAQVQGLANIAPLLSEIEAGTSPYCFIEVMSCTGGCIGGPGQPAAEINGLEARKEILSAAQNGCKIKRAHQNKIATELYKTFLNPEVAHQILHEHRNPNV